MIMISSSSSRSSSCSSSINSTILLMIRMQIKEARAAREETPWLAHAEVIVYTNKSSFEVYRLGYQRPLSEFINYAIESGFALCLPSMGLGSDARPQSPLISNNSGSDKNK